MAKGNDKVKLDEMSFDSGLDFSFDSFDEQPKQMSKREAVVAVSKGVVSGAKDRILSTGFLKKAAKTLLPKEFGIAIDFTDTATGELKDLYHGVATDLKPAADQSKRLVRSVLPKIQDKLPEKMAAHLKSASAPSQVFATTNLENPNKGSDQEYRALSEEYAYQQKGEEKIRQGARDQIEQMRFNTSSSFMKSIAKSTAGQLAFHQRVTYAYQQKSLELGVRSLQAQIAGVEELKQLSKRVSEELGAIRINTALPEIQKITKAEMAKEILANKFIGGAVSSFGRHRDEFFKNFGKNIRTKIKEKLDSYADTVGMMGDMSEMMGSMGDMTEGMSPQERAKMMASMAGGSLPDFLLHIFKNKAKKKLEGSRYARPLNRHAAQAAILMQNKESMVRNWANTSSEGFGASILDFLKESVPSMTPSYSVQRRGIKDLDKPAVITNAFTRSVTETIPAYLAALVREVQILRTGNENISLTRFDYKTGKIVTDADLKKSIFNKLVQKNENLQAYMKDEIKRFDPNNTLSEEEKKAFLDEMLSRQISGQSGVMKDIVNQKHSSAIMNRVMPLLQQHYGTGAKFKDLSDEQMARQASFSMAYGSAGTHLTPDMESIQALVNSGHFEDLVAIGLLNKDGTLDMKKFASYTGGNASPEFGKGITASGHRGFNVKNDVTINRQSTRHITHEVNQNQSSRQFVYGAPGRKVKDAATNAGFMDSMRAHEESYKYKRDDFFTRTTQQLEELKEQFSRGLTIAGFGAAGPEGERPKKRWFQLSIGEALTGMKDGTVKKYREYMAIGRDGFKRMTGWGRQGLGLAGGAADWFSEKVLGLSKDATDIFVKGDTSARLTWKKLKEGHYIDSVTKKPITGWGDLKEMKGDIIDATTGEVVLKAYDLENLQIRVKGRLKALFQGGMERFRQAKSTALQWSADTRVILKNTALFGLRKGRELLQGFMAKDVYVKGESTPKLLAVIMKAGGYASLLNPQKIIRKPTDITGAVITLSDGNVVLTDSDVAKGLVDVTGKPFRTLGGKIKDAAMGAFNAGRQAVRALSGMAGRVWKNVREFFGKTGIVLTSGNDIVNVLEKIHTLLDERLKPRKKKVLGDSDDDGVRDASWQERAKRRAKEAGSAISQGKDRMMEKIRETSLYGLLAGGLGKLFGKKGAKDKDSEEDEDEKGGWMSNLADSLGVASFFGGAKDWVGGKARKVGGALKRGGGRFGRGVGSLLGGTGRLLGRGVMGTGRALGGLGGGAVGMLGRGALGLGRGALGAGKLGLAGLRGAGTVGRATLGRLPLISALIGAGSLYSTWNSDDTLAEKVSDTGDITGGILGGLAAGAAAGAAFGGVGAIPGALIGGLVGAWGGRKIAQAGYNKFKDKTVGAPNAAAGTIESLRMMQYGFKSSQASAVQAIRNLEFVIKDSIKDAGFGAKIDLTKIPSNTYLPQFGINQNSRQDMMNFAKWFARRFEPVFCAYYSAMRAAKVNPPVSRLGSSVIGEELKSVMDKLSVPGGVYSEMTSPFPMQKIEVTSSEIDAERQAVLTGIATVIKNTGRTPSPTDKPETEKKTEESNAELNKAISDIAKEVNATQSNKELGIMSTVGVKLISAGRGYGRKNDELDYVRWKAYGLTALEESKVRTFVILESIVKKDVTYDDKSASWTGSLEDLAAKVGPLFGISSLASKGGANFVTWFNSRFLPVFLLYSAEVRRLTNDKDPLSGADKVREEDKAALARVVRGANTSKWGRSRSIWDVIESPWDGYALNTDATSVDGHIATLATNTTKKLVRNDKPAGITTKTDAAGKTTVASVDKPYRVVGGAAPITQTTINSSTSTVKGGGETYTSSQGTGGLVDKLPMPEGSPRTAKERYAAMKPLIDEVAKMTGMDPKLLATVMGVESGFKSGAAAGTSSAKGLFQFIDETWDYMVAKYGKQYGISANTSPYDVRANAIMGALFLKENMGILKNSLKRDPTAADLYASHFMGPTGAVKFLSMDQNAIAAQAFPKAAAANTNVFYNPDSTPRTVGEIYNYINNRMSATNRSFGIDVNMTASASGNRMPSGYLSNPIPTTGLAPMGANKELNQTPTPDTKPRVPNPATRSVLSDVDVSKFEQPAAPTAPAATAAMRAISTPDTAARAARAQENAATADKRLDTLNDTSTQLLSVQTKSLDVLIAIRDILSAKQIAAANPAAPAQQATGTDNRMPAPPVDMSRRKF